jgi:hypothetical protein
VEGMVSAPKNLGYNQGEKCIYFKFVWKLQSIGNNEQVQAFENGKTDVS